MFLRTLLIPVQALRVHRRDLCVGVRAESGEQGGVVSVVEGESVVNLAAMLATQGPSTPYSAF